MGRITETKPVRGAWEPTAYTDGTTSQQTFTAAPCVVGGLIPMHGAANAGIVTLSDGTRNFAFAIGAIPLGGIMFAGGIELPQGKITVAAAGDDILVLWRPQ